MKIISPLLIALTLTACSAENGTSTESVAGSRAKTEPVSSTAEPDSASDMGSYGVLKDSIAKSLAADWNISEEETRCLLQEHGATHLAHVNTDPEIQAVFEKCGVDPSVVK